MAIETDIAIAGCGPAGGLFGVSMARMGYRVVCACAAPRPARIEGLGQRTVDVLRAHGLQSTLAVIGEPVRRHAVWGAEAADYNREHIASRDRFDAALADDARAAGVDVLTGRCGPVVCDESGVAMTVDGAVEGSRIVKARYFVEARGRAAPRVRKGGLQGPATTALVRQTRPDGRPGTRVASFRDGWAWHVSDAEQAFLQLFVDSTDGLPKRDRLATFFDEHAATISGLGASGWAGPVISRNATTSLSGDLVSLRHLRLGDAAAALDPLSGHGVFAALGSALAATAVTHTILSRPQDAALAMRFYIERTQLGAVRNARIGRDFYRLETRWPGRPFWQKRQAWPDDQAVHGDPGSQPVEIRLMPVVADGFVTEEPVVVTADHPRGVWRVDEVALAPLLERVRDGQNDAGAADVETLAGELQVSPRQVANALNWLRLAGAIA